MIHLLNRFRLHTRELRAFCTGRNALRKMGATIDRERRREERSCLCASSEAGGECLGLPHLNYHKPVSRRPRRASTRWFPSALALFLAAGIAWGGGLTVSNVSLVGAQADALFLQCDVAWSNSWKSPAGELGNWDAAWLFTKARRPGQAWQPARFQKDGHAGPGDCAIEVPADGAGVFIRRRNEGWGPVAFPGIKLRLRPPDPAGGALDKLEGRVLAIEMVYIPAGPFWLGAGGEEEAACFSNPDRESPFQVTGAAPLPLEGEPGGLHVPGAAGKAVPAAWPQGAAAFYCLKYELNQGQYTDFLNMLPAPQAQARFPHRAGTSRHGIESVSNSYACAVPDRACNFLGWQDGVAYADWAGLRPMTEFEFEKACRGPEPALPGEYAWGNPNLATRPYTLTVVLPPAPAAPKVEPAMGALDLMDDVGGLDSTPAPAPAPTPAKPAAAPPETLSASHLTGNALCAATRGTIDGPLPGDAFRCQPQFLLRDELGCSYYGLAEMSGNLWEPCVTLADRAGFAFTGSHGDGLLTESGGATNPDWPGYDAARKEVAGAGGAGLRGGSWQTPPERLRISDRAAAGQPATDRRDDVGWRGARNAP